MLHAKKTNYRWVVCILLFLATTINYIDRQVIGLLKPTLENQFHWSERDYGNIVMAFALCYGLGYIVFGGIVDRVGSKNGYTISIVIWSIAAMLHALVNTTLGFSAVRALLGFGEAGNFPAAVKSTAEWFPRKERALVTGIFNSGTSIGAVVAPVLVPWILGVYGWQMAFLITGAIGLIWLVLWLSFFNSPARVKGVNRQELDYINSDAPETTHTAPLGWGQLLNSKQVWVFIAGKFLTDPIWWFFLFWLPSYFADIFMLDLKKPSPQLVTIYAATTIGSIGGGYLSSMLIKKGYTALKARKVTLFIAACLVVPVIFARYVTDIWMAVLIISVATAAHQAWSSNLFTIVSDLVPKHSVSSAVGMGGMAGSVGSALFPLLVGALLYWYKAHGHLAAGYNILFLISGLVYLLAWLIIHLLTHKKVQFNF